MYMYTLYIHFIAQLFYLIFFFFYLKKKHLFKSHSSLDFSGMTMSPVMQLLKQVIGFVSNSHATVVNYKTALQIQSSLALFRLKGLEMIDEMVPNMNIKKKKNIYIYIYVYIHNLNTKIRGLRYESNVQYVAEQLSSLLTITEYQTTDNNIPAKVSEWEKSSLQNDSGFPHFLSNVEFTGHHMQRQISKRYQSIVQLLLCHASAHLHEDYDIFPLFKLLSSQIHTDDLKTLVLTKPNFFFKPAFCLSDISSVHSRNGAHQMFSHWCLFRVISYAICFPMVSQLSTIRFTLGKAVVCIGDGCNDPKIVKYGSSNDSDHNGYSTYNVGLGLSSTGVDELSWTSMLGGTAKTKKPSGVHMTGVDPLPDSGDIDNSSQQHMASSSTKQTPNDTKRRNKETTKFEETMLLQQQLTMLRIANDEHLILANHL
ncbi:hypothetical protein RFI_15437, partial [Reticulomyxa filosa]